jgi:hypothetical protein
MRICTSLLVVFLHAAFAAAQPEPKPVAAGPTIRNGSMTDGKDAPEGWTNKWEGEGKLKVSRNDKTFKTGPTSLKIETVGGKAKGQIS